MAGKWQSKTEKSSEWQEVPAPAAAILERAWSANEKECVFELTHGLRSGDGAVQHYQVNFETGEQICVEHPDRKRLVRRLSQDVEDAKSALDFLPTFFNAEQFTWDFVKKIGQEKAEKAAKDYTDNLLTSFGLEGGAKDIVIEVINGVCHIFYRRVVEKKPIDRDFFKNTVKDVFDGFVKRVGGMKVIIGDVFGKKLSEDLDRCADVVKTVTEVAEEEQKKDAETSQSALEQLPNIVKTIFTWDFVKKVAQTKALDAAHGVINLALAHFGIIGPVKTLVIEVIDGVCRVFYSAVMEKKPFSMRAAMKEVFSKTVQKLGMQVIVGDVFGEKALEEFDKCADVVNTAAEVAKVEKEEKEAKDKDGTPGAPGKDGNPGTNGTNGKDGTPGTPGTNGTNGTNGKDGATGASGKDAAVPIGPAGSKPSAAVFQKLAKVGKCSASYDWVVAPGSVKCDTCGSSKLAGYNCLGGSHHVCDECVNRA